MPWVSLADVNTCILKSLLKNLFPSKTMTFTHTSFCKLYEKLEFKYLFLFTAKSWNKRFVEHRSWLGMREDLKLFAFGR